MDMKAYLTEASAKNGLEVKTLQLPDCGLEPKKIKVVMISEVPHKNPSEGFYGAGPETEYMKSALGLFAEAGFELKDMDEILGLGIYVTTAVKSPKAGYTVEPEIIKSHLPILKAELSLFQNLKVIMLMGDVARKAVNMLAKAETKKNVVPSGSTCNLRSGEYFWGEIRVFPSYIMTGKNLIIEPFKRECVAEDIRRMTEYLKKRS